MDGRRTRVIVLGAGFGGLWAAKELERADADVLLIDRNNYHTFFPLLYQVAAAEVGADEIAAPVRKIISHYSNVDFTMEHVRRVDLRRKMVVTDKGEHPYDYLIMALGSEPFYFGVKGAPENTFALKDIEQAVRLRNHLLYLFELAEREPDPVRRRKMLTFAIAGGGPTGVEFAGALAELVHGAIRRDHKRLDVNEMRIILIEALPRLLKALPAPLGEYALRRLEKMGVEIILGAAVTEVNPDALILKDGRVLPTQTVVWTAGVQSEPAAQKSAIPAFRSGQALVLDTLQAQGQNHVYVIGDSSRLEQQGNPLPMLAPVAIQQGTWAGRNIRRELEGKPPIPFHYKDRGTMVTIGRNAGVAVLYGRPFVGLPAWLLWVGVHIYNLIGFRSRLAVLASWAVDYFFYEREVRLIIPTPQALDIEAVGAEEHAHELALAR